MKARNEGKKEGETQKELFRKASRKERLRIDPYELLMKANASCELDPSLYSLAEIGRYFDTYKGFCCPSAIHNLISCTLIVRS